MTGASIETTLELWASSLRDVRCGCADFSRKASCGVGRQYTGSAGKITNCQIGVFAAYVSRHGHAFIDRGLYLPKSWTGDPARMAGSHVPPGTAFATKPALAVQMIDRAIRARVPFAWVAADSIYGVNQHRSGTPAKTVLRH